MNHFLALTKMAEVWLQLIQIKEEEAVDRKELLDLWKQMAQLLQECLKDGELDIKTQQHVRFPNIRTAFCCALIYRGLKDHEPAAASLYAHKLEASVYCWQFWRVVKIHQNCFPFFNCPFALGR